MIKFIGYIYYWKLQFLNNAKVCRWLASGRSFSSGTPVSSTNKTDCHDITEILLKVDLNTITLSYPTLNNAMIIKTYVLLPQSKHNFSYPAYALWLCCSKKSKNIWLWTYQMNVIPETRREHERKKEKKKEEQGAWSETTHL